MGILRAARRCCAALLTTILVIASAYLFWAAARCQAATVDQFGPPFTADLDVPFPAGPYRRASELRRIAAAIEPDRFLLFLNARLHGDTTAARFAPARTAWVRVTVRGLLMLTCLSIVAIATWFGWLRRQYSLRMLFAIITVTAVACWLHGRLHEWNQLRPNRDLAWAVGLTLIGMAAGAWLANHWERRTNSTRKPDAEHKRQERPDDARQGITVENGLIA